MLRSHEERWGLPSHNYPHPSPALSIAWPKMDEAAAGDHNLDIVEGEDVRNRVTAWPLASKMLIAYALCLSWDYEYALERS